MSTNKKCIFIDYCLCPTLWPAVPELACCLLFYVHIFIILCLDSFNWCGQIEYSDQTNTVYKLYSTIDVAGMDLYIEFNHNSQHNDRCYVVRFFIIFMNRTITEMEKLRFRAWNILEMNRKYITENMNMKKKSELNRKQKKSDTPQFLKIKALITDALAESCTEYG